MTVDEAVLASALAYLPEASIRKAYPSCDFISYGGTQCFVDDSDERVLIAFRGTEADVQDWMTDLDFTKTAGVHRGFNDALRDVWPLLKTYCTVGKPFHVTGHSLGAALAGLCAYRMACDGVKNVSVYAFGQPRMGDEEFQASYDSTLYSSTYRFVNNNDIVTRIPPRAFGYRHVGKLCYFKEDGTLSRSSSEWSRFLDRINGRIEDIGEWGFDGVKDHAIEQYERLITENNKNND